MMVAVLLTGSGWRHPFGPGKHIWNRSEVWEGRYLLPHLRWWQPKLGLTAGQLHRFLPQGKEIRRSVKKIMEGLLASS